MLIKAIQSIKASWLGRDSCSTSVRNNPLESYTHEAVIMELIEHNSRLKMSRRKSFLARKVQTAA